MLHRLLSATVTWFTSFCDRARLASISSQIHYDEWKATSTIIINTVRERKDVSVHICFQSQSGTLICTSGHCWSVLTVVFVFQWGKSCETNRCAWMLVPACLSLLLAQMGHGRWWLGLLPVMSKCSTSNLNAVHTHRKNGSHGQCPCLLKIVIERR